MYKNVVLIHGIGGLDREMYFPHLKEVLENMGIKVYAPSLGGYKDGTKYANWVKYYDKEILPILNNETIVVAQSMGTQFAVKYMAHRKPTLGLYISTAAPSAFMNIRKEMQDKAKLFKPVATPFVPNKEEKEIFKSLPFKKYSYYSNNDNFFSQENLENYSLDIGSTPIFIENMQHFNTEEITKGFKELEDFIINEIKNKRD